MKGDLRKVHNEELHYTMINLMYTKCVAAKPKTRYHLADLGVDRYILDTEFGLDSSGSG
jgi:hypothetical protein